MDFPLEAENPGNTQHFLMQLRDSKLQDDALLDSFFDKVIASYPYGENYYIILIHVIIKLVTWRSQIINGWILSEKKVYIGWIRR